MSDAILYDYWRSTASYRVRIALNLAGINYESVSIDLVKGEQRSDAHKQKHPQGLVPVLEIDGRRLTQSLAILEYLNCTRNLDLLPNDAELDATVRALSYSIAMDIHPVCNLSVVGYATKGEEPARTDWMRRFIGPGLDAFEQQLAQLESAVYCVGGTITLADLCLIPQLYNADRWGVDYSAHAHINRVASNCAMIAAFKNATPESVKPG
jgi:maleylacetoacetate isomerase